MGGWPPAQDGCGVVGLEVLLLLSCLLACVKLELGTSESVEKRGALQP
jgi:hypothetical protein